MKEAGRERRRPTEEEKKKPCYPLRKAPRQQDTQKHDFKSLSSNLFPPHLPPPPFSPSLLHSIFSSLGFLPLSIPISRNQSYIVTLTGRQTQSLEPIGPGR